MIWIRTAFAALCLSTIGCRQPAPPVVEVSSDTAQDVSHDHRHLHGAGQFHEHEHTIEFEGAHEHPHRHGHRHAAPLYGGRIIAIDHDHHEPDKPTFHAEVLPVEDRVVTLIFLSDIAGQFQAVDPKIEQFAAVMETSGTANDDRPTSNSLSFKRASAVDGSIRFSADLPRDWSPALPANISVADLKLGESEHSWQFSLSNVSSAD